MVIGALIINELLTPLPRIKITAHERGGAGLLLHWKWSSTSHELFLAIMHTICAISSAKYLVSFCIATVVALLLLTEVYSRVATFRQGHQNQVFPACHSTSVAKYRLAYVSVGLALSLPYVYELAIEPANSTKLSRSTAFHWQLSSPCARERTPRSQLDFL